MRRLSLDVIRVLDPDMLSLQSDGRLAKWLRRLTGFQQPAHQGHKAKQGRDHLWFDSVDLCITVAKRHGARSM